VVAAIEPSHYWFYAIFWIIAMFSTAEFVKINHGDKLHAGLYTVATLLMFSSTSLFFFNKYIIAAYLGYMLVLMLIELWLKAENPIRNWELLALSQMYIAVPISCMAILRDANLLLALFVLIWVNDSFAFLTGSYLGKHRMFERISPKKSWEGFVGGNLFALGAALIFAHYMPQYTIWQWLIIGEIVVVFGTLGDLVESLMKRTLKIKDSGNSIPGHGGFLDRFDSALIASVALTIVIYFL